VYTVSGVSDWGSLEFDDIPDYDDYAEDWDAVTFNKDANGYRLPTEVEWVWAAMGASAGGDDVRNNGWAKGYAGSAEGWDVEDYAIIENIGNYAWYDDDETDVLVSHQVGKKTANELGLYDMSGNVREWCWDWYVSWWVSSEEAFEGEALPDDFAGPTEETDNIDFEYRTLRGGSFVDYDSNSALSYRDYWEPYIGEDPEEAGCVIFGFRIVCNEE
jgi:formylglycine-generating enzyme required for sulfatase activity